MPGDDAAVEPAALWPAAWGAAGGDCAAVYVCSEGESAATLVPGAACDDGRTEAVEQCVPPTADLAAPSTLSACAGATLTLDGAFSSAGGARPASYNGPSTLTPPTITRC